MARRTLRTAVCILVCGAAAAGVAGCGGDGGGSQAAGITATDGPGLFEAANCASCHVLAAADAQGRIGPNLDELRPDAATVRGALVSGPGSMPSFRERLDDAQLDTLSTWVAEQAGR